MAATLVVAVLLIFSLLSILNQISPQISLRLSFLDRLDLLPNWKFFAPVPGTQDFRIVYQDSTSDEVAGSWREWDVIVSGRKLVDGAWNPRKHFQKAAIDVAQILLLDAAKIRDLGIDKSRKEAALKLTWSYCAILKQVSELPKAKEGAIYRRFAILKSHGFRGSDMSLEPIFVSFRHQL